MHFKGTARTKFSLVLQLRLNDTGSTERFRSVPTNYFRHSHGVVLVYDVTNPTSLYDLEDWMVDAYSKTAEDSTITYTIIGTRLDKVEETGTESSDCKHFCERFGIPEYLQFRVSDLSEGLHQSLMEIFKTLAQTIHVTQSGGNVTKTRNYNHLRSSERALLLSSDQDSEKSTPCFKC